MPRASGARPEVLRLLRGTSRGLPERMLKLIARSMFPRPRRSPGFLRRLFAPPVAVAAAGLVASLDHWVDTFDYLSPRTAAVSVMAVLAFGVLWARVIGPALGTSPIYVMPAAQQASVQGRRRIPPPWPRRPRRCLEEVAEEAAAAEETPLTGPPARAKPINHVWLIVLRTGLLQDVRRSRRRSLI